LPELMWVAVTVASA